MSGIALFLLKIVVVIFYIYTAYLPAGHYILKTLGLVFILFITFESSLKKLWLKYKRRQNQKL